MLYLSRYAIYQALACDPLIAVSFDNGIACGLPLVSASLGRRVRIPMPVLNLCRRLVTLRVFQPLGQ
jgi:hypothetical protein